MLGCGLNNVALEAMVKIDPGSGNLLTFLQFLFIASYEFFAHSFDFRKFWLRPRKVALRYYLLMTFVFAVLSVVNNMAFDYHISQPLHMVFRSSTLAASLIVGLLFHERYMHSIDKPFIRSNCSASKVFWFTNCWSHICYSRSLCCYSSFVMGCGENQLSAQPNHVTVFRRRLRNRPSSLC